MSCPKCQSENGLNQLIELTTDDSDERSKSHESWSQCKSCGDCFYGETVDYFDSDDFTFKLYEAEPAAWAASLKLAQQCPAPHNPLCRCPAHTRGRVGIIKLWTSNSVYYGD